MVVDLFPFLRLMGDTPEKQIGEIVEYLMQFKEMVEFALGNISTDNLSPEFATKLSEIEGSVNQINKNREEDYAQIISKILKTSDIFNSEAFKSAVAEECKKYIEESEV